MFKVEIDVAAILAQAKGEAQTVLTKAVSALGIYARDQLVAQASGKLSRANFARYKRALKVEGEGTNEITISLDDPKIEGLETGTGGFDIKPGLLNGPKVKRSKDGSPYADVPFEHSLKRSAPNRIATRQGRSAARETADLVEASGKSARALTSRADRADPRTRRYAGMVVSPQKEMRTFRRVSPKSAPDSWRYPARRGVGAFETVAQAVAKMSVQVLGDVVKKRQS